MRLCIKSSVLIKNTPIYHPSHQYNENDTLNALAVLCELKNLHSTIATT